MNVLEFLTRLRDCDIQVWVQGDRLRCNAPAGALRPEWRETLRCHKAEILKFLSAAESFARQQRSIVPLQPRGSAAPIFAVAGHNGDVFCFRVLAQQLGVQQPFFGLQPPGLDGSRAPLGRVEDLAAYFAGQLRALRPEGPYVIAGYCAGGAIALELARQLARDGAAVEMLALFGSPFPTWYRGLPQLRQRLRQSAGRLVRHGRALAVLPAGQGAAYLAERLRTLNAQRLERRRAALDPVLVWREQVGQATLAAIRRYAPARFTGRLALFWPSQQCGGNALRQWPSIASATETYFGPEGCDGSNMLRPPYAAAFADLFRQAARNRPHGKTAPSTLSRIAPTPRESEPTQVTAALPQPMNAGGNAA